MKASKIALGAIIGASIGVVAGVLTAPKSGRETREDLKRKAGEAKDKASTARDDVLYRAEELGEDVRAKAAEKLENVKSALKK